jgi:acetoin utilization protein AcuB
MLMPSISRYMSRQPKTIERGATLQEAHRMMREHLIRHLPVLENGALVGIVSRGDLHLMEALPGAAPGELTVEEAMTSEVYGVGLDEPVDVVVETMASRKLGSAVVLDRRGEVCGIFTTMDALQVLAEVLRRVTA